MIRTVEALRFRSLHFISQRLDDFHVLVGPNATGKTTFCDTIAFLGDLVSQGLEEAIHKRTQDFQHLVWRHENRPMEIAIELAIPEELHGRTEKDFRTCRYEVAIGNRNGATEILAEKVILQPARAVSSQGTQRTLFPKKASPPTRIISPRSSPGMKTVVNKVRGGNDNFYDETGKGWDHAFKLGPYKSALGNLPEDESKFPVSTWLKRTLRDGIQRIVLNSELMQRPSPPGKPRDFRPDGSNLPWVIHALAKEHPDRLKEWVAHLRTALGDLRAIGTFLRPEDRHRYLTVTYEGGLEVPSWMVSDGTMRLFALTLPAYLPHLQGVFLIEEPENGIHPGAIEIMFQSLSSVYGAQILMATHSPFILSIAEPSQVPCFAKTPEGETDIVRGSEHPALKDWLGDPNLAVLFAAGVLS